MPTEDTEPLIALCDAIVADLSATTFSQEITARRGYSIRGELPEMDKPEVLLLPTGINENNATRGSVLEDWTVFAAVRRKLPLSLSPDETRNEMDGLMRLSRQVKEHLIRRNFDLGSIGKAAYLRCQTIMPYGLAEFDTNNTFVSVLELTYQQRRS